MKKNLGKIIAALALLASLAMIGSSLYELWAMANTSHSIATLTVIVQIYALAILILGIAFLIASAIALKPLR
jgi:hypothetical protein